MVARPDGACASRARREPRSRPAVGPRTSSTWPASPGVSHQTVSRVINDMPNVRPSTRARVEQAIAQLHYSPSPAARALVTRRTRTIGLVTPGHLRLRPHLDRDGLQLRGPGGALQRRDGERPARRRQGDPRGRRRPAAPAGGRDHAGRRPTSSVLEMVRSLDLSIPVVVAASTARRSPLIVSIDQYRGARSAVRHLAELGHTRILHIAGPKNAAGRDRAGPRLARRARRPAPRDRPAGARRLVRGQRPPARLRPGRPARHGGVRRQRPDVDRPLLRAARARPPGARRTSA